jgi:hypothetical protein
MSRYAFCNSGAVLLLTACASTPTQKVYVAPTRETVFATVEESQGAPGHMIFVENRSSVPVTVYSVSLRDCQNVKGQCSVHPVNIHLDAGRRSTLLRVEPADPQKGFNCHYSFGWRADSTTTLALGALAANGDAVAQRQLDAMHRADERRRHEVGSQDLDLTPSDISALATPASSLRASPDSLVLRVGDRATLDTIHVLLLGGQNEILGRVHGLQWRVGSPAVRLVPPDTLVAAAAGRALLQLRLPDAFLPDQPALHVPLQVPIVVRQ